MNGRVLPTVLVLALAVSPIAPTTASEVVLRDGRAIQGEVSRDGDNYVVTLPGGDVVVLPVEVVEEVRLTAEPRPEPPRPGPPPAVIETVPRTLAGQDPPEGPSGLRSGAPESLAGPPLRPPTRSEQLEVLGPPAELQANLIDPTWVPESDWEMNPANNNFAPSTWAESVIDPSWQPKSAFDADKDVLERSRSTFKPSIIDASWAPTDGFGKK